MGRPCGFVAWRAEFALVPSAEPCATLLAMPCRRGVLGFEAGEHVADAAGAVDADPRVTHYAVASSASAFAQAWQSDVPGSHGSPH
jgi:hypothetical protein